MRERDSLMISRKIKKYKISLFTEWCLRQRGKYDCKKNVLRLNVNGKYFSPYINKEIKLCLADVHKEIEVLAELQKKYNMEIKEIEASVITKTRQVSSINSFIDKLNENAYCMLNCDNKENFNGNDTFCVAKRKQIDSFSKKIDLLNLNKEKCIIMSQKEVDVTYWRCKQRYDFLMSKISVYWNGALSVDKSERKIPPVFEIEDNLLGLVEQIESLKI